jgi:hypothetical protein
MSNTLIPKNVGAPISSRYDARVGLGYGQLAQKFHKPWRYTDTFPFYAADEAEDIIDNPKDEESKEAIDVKVADFLKTDPLAFKGANRLYFVGASTNLAACFERTEDVLEEITGVARGIVPIPGLYGKIDGPAVGGYSSWKAFDGKSFKRTGTKQGWSQRPPQSKVAAEDEEEEDEFYDLSDLANLQKLSLGECFAFYDHT